MFQTYFDPSPTPVKPADAKRLDAYRTEVEDIFDRRDTSRHEYALVHATPELVGQLEAKLSPLRKRLRHLVMVGIGGSSLGLEALVAALPVANGPTLTVLDMITPAALESVVLQVSKCTKAEQVVVCVISKSGATTETLANAAVLVRILADKFGDAAYQQVVYVGDPGTSLQTVAKKTGGYFFAMPAIVGGRYSVATEVGLVPLLLLGYPAADFVTGMAEVQSAEVEAEVAERALRLYASMTSGLRHYNFFAFESRLYKLGCWYRQLAAESLGKATDRAGRSVKYGFVPTITTPVELHSIGQLYFSGFPGVFTEFVSIDDDGVDYKVGPTKLAPALKKFTLEEIQAGLYRGVVAAYEAKSLPYRATVLSENVALALGRYMAMAMLETMYVAHLLNIDAFDQPNVELYKEKTREVLGL